MTGQDRLFEPVVQRSEWIDLDESTFEFLARGGRQEASETREWMEEEWSEISSCRRKGLGNRLNFMNSKQFIEGYFELQVHRLLRRLGLENRHRAITCWDRVGSSVPKSWKRGSGD